MYICICMNLWGVAVLELDSILTTTRDQTTHLALVQRPITKIIDPSHTKLQEVLTVHGNELRLFGANAFPLTPTINVAHLK